jgi:hypothetical protein
MTSIKQWVLAGALGTGLVAGAGAWSAAQACGGLFCSSANPVNQAAERIVFSFDRSAKKVTAVVEILYAGPSEKFAWVLPVPGVPEVGVSTSALLDRLQQITNPTYSIQRSWAGSCANDSAVPTRAPTPSPGSAGANDPSRPNVSVLAAGSAGPYDYEVIKVDPGMADAAIVALNWLAANHYDVGALGADVLRPYLRDGLNLLAVRLAKNKNQMTGSIRPIMLTYASEHPMIPIRPTAVAANDDMGILAFVLGASRAVPTNYKSLELNEAMIDWFTPNATYNAVVTAAANEAMGQGFVTEYANSTGMGGFASGLYAERNNVQQFRSNADQLSPANLVVSMIETLSTFAQGNFGGPFGARPSGGRVALDGVTDVVASQLKLPVGVTADQVVASPRCYFAELQQQGAFYCDGKTAPTPGQTIDLTTFDKRAFLTAVEALVIAPMEKTAKLFADQPYLTRFYTTMSAGEMTLDPEFDLNNELGDVSATHVLDMKYTTGCSGDTSGTWEATVGGVVVRGKGSTWPVNASMAGAGNMPSNRRILQLGPTGTGTMITDNTAAIAQALGGSQPVAAGGTSGGGCSVAGGAAAGGGATSVFFAGVAALAAFLRRRRR